MMAARLMFGRHRWMITSWSVLLIALAGVTVSADQSTYTTPEQRRMATELAQHDAASTLLYGALAAPGSPALMFTWEIGAITTILVAIVAVLLAVSLTRAAEDDGTMEILRSAGIGARVPLRSAFAVMALVAGIFTLGCTVAVGLNAGRVDAVSWPGRPGFRLCHRAHLPAVRGPYPGARASGSHHHRRPSPGVRHRHRGVRRPRLRCGAAIATMPG